MTRLWPISTCLRAVNMSLATELKRRLESDERPIVKRLKLAENVLTYPFFPAINREEIVLAWLCSKLEVDNNELHNSITTLKQCVRSLNFKTFSQVAKDQLFSSLATLLRAELPDIVNNTVLECCFNMIENPTANSQFQQSPLEIFSIYQLILSNISHYRVDKSVAVQDAHIKRALNNLHSFIKSSNKKMMLANSFIDSNLLPIIFKFSNNEQFAMKIFSVCQLIIFPPQSSSLFKMYLVSMLRGDDLTTLFQEKGEALRPVVTVMDLLFKYQNSSTFSEVDLLTFFKYFTNSYKFDDNLMFIFNVIFYKCLGIHQEYVQVSDLVKSINLTENFMKEVHLQNLKLLSDFNININLNMSFVKSKDEDKNNKKSFFTFLQQTTNNILKGNILNNLSLSIIKETFILDPEILEPNLATFLPEIIAQKKNKDVLNSYEDILMTILELMYKMSRGPDFVFKILPVLKLKLEEIDSDQQQLSSKISTLFQKDEESIKKMQSKLLAIDDIFPERFCNRFGKLNSNLMSWQHIDFFKLLIKYLNDFCIANLEKSTIYPSTILLAEVLCSLLSSFCHNSKMADQNVPETVYKKFDSIFETYGTETLLKFATAIQNFPTEIRLHRAFFDVCKSYGHLKLVLWQYQPHFILAFVEKCTGKDNNRHISDVTMLHSYIPNTMWKNVYKLVGINDDKVSKSYMNILILQNAIVEIYLKSNKEPFLWNNCVKMHILNNLNDVLSVFENEELYLNAIFSNLSSNDMNVTCNKIVSGICDGSISDLILKKGFIYSNRNIISTVASECVRSLWFHYDSNESLKRYTSLYVSSNTEEFDIKTFFSANDKRVNHVNALISCDIFEKERINELEKIFNLLNQIPIHFVKENVQNSVLFCIFIIQLSLKESNKLSKCLKRIQNDCTSIVYKIFDSSYKLLNVFDIIPPQSMIQLIDGNYFKLTTFTNTFDVYYMLKQIFLGILVNGNLVNLDTFIPLLFKSSQIDEESEFFSNLTLNNSFQTMSLFYTIFSSFKKTNLAADLKFSITKHQNDMSNHLVSYFDNINWINATNNICNTDKKSPEVPANDESIDITVNDSERCAYLNLVMPYVTILSNEVLIQNESNANVFKKLTKAIDFFLKLCLEELLNKNINLHHAKGCCLLINLVLKIYKSVKKSITTDEDALNQQIWQSSKYFLQTSHDKVGAEWMEVHTMTLDNIKLTYELCGVKFFNSFLIKELLQSSKLMVESTSDCSLLIGNTYVMKSLWSCFLNANFKITGKTEARSSAVKQMIKNCFFWFKNMPNTVHKKLDDQNETVHQLSDTNTLQNPPVKTSIEKNLEIINVCFEVVAEFVATKKMILSNNLIDSIIQMPIIIDFDLSNNLMFNQEESLDAFCMIFDKCILLLRNLLLFRLELLQDRLPAFLQSYRKLINMLSIKSNSDHVLNKNDIEKLVTLALNMEKLTQVIVKNEKQDVSRIAPYVVADIVSSFQKVSICPPVKFHLQNCAYCLMQLLDNHGTGFLMRNLPDASRIMFQQLYDNYKKYYKYMGTS